MNHGEYNYYGNNPHYYNYNQYNYENGGGNNYNNNHSNMQQRINNSPMKLDEALSKSTYPKYIQSFIKDFLTNNYCKHGLAKVYLTSVENDKLFVIDYCLPTILNNRIYKIDVLVYLPTLYPNYAPEFYICQKKGNTGISEKYYDGRINPTNLQINIDNFLPFDALKNNIEEIIYKIIDNFNKDFPIYKKDKNEPGQINSGKCFLNKNLANEIIIENNNNNKDWDSEHNIKSMSPAKINNNNNSNNNNYNFNKNDFDDNTFLDYMRNQTKDIVRAKYMDLTSSFNNITQNHNELKSIDNSLKIKSQGGINSSLTHLRQKLEKLQNIKILLNQIENNLIQEYEQMQISGNKNVFDKCDEIVNIKDGKELEYIIMSKTIEDYLVYLKKGYEKKIISFEEMLHKTRMLSRELFSINYLLNKIKFENSL